MRSLQFFNLVLVFFLTYCGETQLNERNSGSHTTQEAPNLVASSSNSAMPNKTPNSAFLACIQSEKPSTGKSLTKATQKCATEKGALVGKDTLQEAMNAIDPKTNDIIGIDLALAAKLKDSSYFGCNGFLVLSRPKDGSMEWQKAAASNTDNLQACLNQLNEKKDNIRISYAVGGLVATYTNPDAGEKYLAAGIAGSYDNMTQDLILVGGIAINTYPSVQAAGFVVNLDTQYLLASGMVCGLVNGLPLCYPF